MIWEKLLQFLDMILRNNKMGLNYKYNFEDVGKDCIIGKLSLEKKDGQIKQGIAGLGVKITPEKIILGYDNDNALWVDPKYQNKGHGYNLREKIIEMSIKICEEKDFHPKKIVSEIVKGNGIMEKIMKKSGFQKEKEDNEIITYFKPI